ncbi:MAG: DUF3499 family protein [Actinomycetota bacterium]|nr:DUF3499 family protein [Actinomycetota bacterium]
MRLCSKPGCGGPAIGLLGYNYAEKRALLEDAAERDIPPHLYALCAVCADRLNPPRGWILEDRRYEPPLFLPREPALESLAE